MDINNIKHLIKDIENLIKLDKRFIKNKENNFKYNVRTLLDNNSEKSYSNNIIDTSKQNNILDISQQNNTLDITQMKDICDIMYPEDKKIIYELLEILKYSKEKFEYINSINNSITDLLASK